MKSQTEQEDKTGQHKMPIPDFLELFGLPAKSAGEIVLEDSEPVVASSFKIATASAQAVLASAAAAADFHATRGGRPQTISASLPHALAECRSERHLRIGNGVAPELWDPIAGAYRCGDGSFVRIHTNFAHHRDGILKLLGCNADREAVQKAIEKWRGYEFETAASEAGLCVAFMRNFDEWDATEQAAAIKRQPLINIEQATGQPARILRCGARPLTGIKVIEMTRIIAGPVAGRVLAGHGADVMRLIGKDVPTVEPIDVDTGHGKRSAYINLDDNGELSRLHSLLEEADVFLHSYRPDAFDRYGLDAASLHKRHPHLVYASLSAYGSEGPWAGRRGFDSLTQTATGFNHAEASAFGEEKPRGLPAQILDHASGQFLAAAIISALSRRARTGGGYRVHVSLARTGLWLRSLGRLPAASVPDLAQEQASAFIETVPSPYGNLTRVKSAAVMSDTPIHFAHPSSPYGSDDLNFSS